jgi:hypothetical protein
MFVPGQAYVALSRARSKEGLQIVSWDGRVIDVDKIVDAFYKDFACTDFEMDFDIQGLY